MPGVVADLVHPRGNFLCQAVVLLKIDGERYIGLLPDLFEPSGVVFAVDCQPHDGSAGTGELLDLRHRRIDVLVRVAHMLCTATGAAPPTVALPMRTARVCLRGESSSRPFICRVLLSSFATWPRRYKPPDLAILAMLTPHLAVAALLEAAWALILGLDWPKPS